MVIACFKGHLRYKTIISQNVSSEAQVKNILFDKKIMFRSRDIQVFVFLTIRYFTKFVTSWVLDRMHFSIYPLNHNSLTHQIWSIDRCKQGQHFSEIFWAIQKTGAKFKAIFNLVTCSNYLSTNYVKFPVLHFFEKGE